MPQEAELRQTLLDRARTAIAGEFPDALTTPIYPSFGSGGFMEWLGNFGPMQSSSAQAQTKPYKTFFGVPIPFTDPFVTYNAERYNSEDDLGRLIQTLAHEFTHVKQLKKDKGAVFREFDLPYADRPHEHEAFATGDRYLRRQGDISLDASPIGKFSQRKEPK